MTWLKNNLAWLLLLLVLGTGTGLYVTGRLEIHWHPQEATSAPEGQEEEREGRGRLVDDKGCN
jgi:hypothetical protein